MVWVHFYRVGVIYTCWIYHYAKKLADRSLVRQYSMKPYIQQYKTHFYVGRQWYGGFHTKSSAFVCNIIPPVLSLITNVVG